MMGREFWRRGDSDSRDDQSSRVEGLAEKFDALRDRLSRLEQESERMSAQILFTEKALTSCLERERALRRTQDDLRIELLSNVHGLTTE